MLAKQCLILRYIGGVKRNWANSIGNLNSLLKDQTVYLSQNILFNLKCYERFKMYHCTLCNCAFLMFNTKRQMSNICLWSELSWIMVRVVFSSLSYIVVSLSKKNAADSPGQTSSLLLILRFKQIQVCTGVVQH